MTTWRDLMDATPWPDLVHAYGSAEDVPDLLDALTQDVEAADEAVDELFGAVLHQGTIYPATIPVVRVLGRMLVDGAAASPRDPLLLLCGYAMSVDQGWTTNPRYLPTGTDLVAFDREARDALAQVAPAVQAQLRDVDGEALRAAAQFFQASPEGAEPAAQDLLAAARSAGGALQRSLVLALSATSGRDQALALVETAGREQEALWRVLHGHGDEPARRLVANSTTLLTNGFDEAVWDGPELVDLATVDPGLALALVDRPLSEAEMLSAGSLLLDVARGSRRWGPAAETRLEQLTGRLSVWQAREVRGLRGTDFARGAPTGALTGEWAAVRLGVARAQVRRRIIDRILEFPENDNQVYRAALEAVDSALLRGPDRVRFLADLTDALQASVATPATYGPPYGPLQAALTLLALDENWRGDPDTVLDIVLGVVATPNRTSLALRLASTLLGTPAEPALRQRLTEGVESDRRIQWLFCPVSADDYVVAQIRAWLAEN